MTNRLAIWLFIVIIVLLILDYFVLQGGGLIYASRKGIDLINLLAVWR